MRAVSLAFSLLVGTGLATADVLTFTFTYPEPVITPEGDEHRVEIPGCRSIGQAGEPRLPVHGVTILLPPGHSLLRVEASARSEVLLPGTYKVQVVQRQYPYSYQGPWEQTSLLPTLAEREEPFPEFRVANPLTGFMNGYSVGAFTVHPVAYTPSTGQLRYFPEVVVNVTTGPTPEAQEAFSTMFRGKERDRFRVASRVLNGDLLASYPSPDENRNPDYDLLLVTPSSFSGLVAPYIQYRTVRGWKVAVQTTESIYASYPGVDNPARIRNCIKDYYLNHGIDYVLLAGDNETIPHRGLYNDPGGGYADPDIPADLYFAGLDGSWNTDGDSYWGENDAEADLLAEVFVARICADDVIEFSNVFNKTVAYLSNPVVNECEKALMVGELLWNTTPPTYGDTYKEEIRLGASTHGYTTVGFPPNFTVNVLYDSQGTWSGMNDLRPLLNNGVHLVNHLGHANVDYYMKLYNSNLTDVNFTNDGVNHSFYITYSQGCYCGSFDNRTTSGGYVSDCINERIVFELSHGAVATIANSRYGWGAYNSTNGSSQYYDRQFFDAIFGEGITNIAEANQDSKEDNIPFINFEQNRWCYYELNVFGDVLLDIWTAAPTPMVVNHAPAYVIGEPTFTVGVPGVANARVALSRNGQLLGRGFTDALGTAVVQFEAPPQVPGPMDLYVTAHNRLEYHGTVEVISPSGPYVVAIGHSIDDNLQGASWGDADGEVDLGETVEFGVQLKNVGVDAALGVWATLTSASPYVSFHQATQAYGDLAAGQEAWSAQPFVFSVGGGCPDRSAITIQVTATSGAQSWNSSRSILVNAPAVALESHTLSEVVGDGDGKPEAGETVRLVVRLVNNGHGTAWNLQGVLGTTDGFTSILNPSMTFPTLAPGASGNGSPVDVAFSPSTPLGHIVTFTLSLTAAGGYSGSASFFICVGRKPLLFVDTDNEAHDNRIVQALNSLGITYDTWLWYTAGSPGLQRILQYEVVFWAAGDQNQSSCNAQDRSDLATYLDNGGALLFSAENYLTAYGSDPFTTQYLHIGSYGTNVSGVTSVVGVSGDPIGSGLQVSISFPSDLSDTPDTVAPGPGAATVFRISGTGKSTAIRYPASGQGPHRVVFFGTPLEAFSPTGAGENNLAGVLNRCLTWLRGGPDLEAPQPPAWAQLSPSGLLTWAPASDNVGVVSYRIYRSALAYFQVTGLTPWATTQGTSWQITEGMGNPSLNYFYRVTAVDGSANESAPSPTVGEYDFLIDQ